MGGAVPDGAGVVAGVGAGLAGAGETVPDPAGDGLPNAEDGWSGAAGTVLGGMLGGGLVGGPELPAPVGGAQDGTVPSPEYPDGGAAGGDETAGGGESGGGVLPFGVPPPAGVGVAGETGVTGAMGAADAGAGNKLG